MVLAFGFGALGLVLHLHRDGAVGRLLAVGLVARRAGLQRHRISLREVADASMLARYRIEQFAGNGKAFDA